MNKSLLLSALLSGFASSGSIAMSLDLFDAPGPGYRQQIDRLAPHSAPLRSPTRIQVSPAVLEPIGAGQSPANLPRFRYELTEPSQPNGLTPSPVERSGFLYEPTRLFDLFKAPKK